jgi:hypothetical protein
MGVPADGIAISGKADRWGASVNPAGARLHVCYVFLYYPGFLP